MAFLLLIMAFISIFGLVSTVSTGGKRENLITTVIVFSIICLLITEGLSYLKALNYWHLILTWGSTIFLTSLLIYNKEGRPNVVWYQPLAGFKFSTIFDKRVSYIMLGFLGLIFIQGLIYPPNNWDSLSYHLVRVVHWISNETVAHYPAHDYRQIHQAPFGEYLLTHINILVGSDYLANSLQLVYLFFLMVVGSLLGKELGLNGKYQLISAFFILTIPQAIIQASSTKNDIISCFYIIATAWYMLKFVRQQSFANFLFIGLATGLAMLTKTTTYLFLFPILLCFGIWMVINSWQSKNWTNFRYAFLVALVVILTNASFFYRNYALTQNIMGVDPTEDNGYSNSKFTGAYFFSNLTRNVSLHLAPFPISRASEWSVKKLHDLFNWNVNNPDTTFGITKYKVTNYPNGEGDSPNVGHFLLLVMSLFFVFKKRIQQKEKWLVYILAGVIISQFMFFCFYLKWQPWHTRLHLPIFFLGGPLIAYYLQNRTNKIAESAIIFGIAAYSFAIILLNSPRPFITVPKVTNNISILDNRNKKLLISLPHLETDYKIIKEYIETAHCQSVVLMDVFEVEYVLLDELNRLQIKPYNVAVNNISREVPQHIPDSPDFLITKKNTKQIEFQNKAYKNLNPANQHLYIYSVDSSQHSSNLSN